MRIMILDDEKKNLTAARQAAGSFPEYEFDLFSEIREGGRLNEFDGVISDLFFPRSESSGSLKISYEQYIEQFNRPVSDNECFQEILADYYKGEDDQAERKLEDIQSLISSGNYQLPLERLRRFYARQKDNEIYKDSYSEICRKIDNPPPTQFPYGAAIMLLAKRAKKKICLVTDLHRHATSYESHASSLDGMILLMPLVSEGIFTVPQLRRDGADCLTYMGRDEIRKIAADKTNYTVWAEAIRRIIKQ